MGISGNTKKDIKKNIAKLSKEEIFDIIRQTKKDKNPAITLLECGLDSKQLLSKGFSPSTLRDTFKLDIYTLKILGFPIELIRQSYSVNIGVIARVGQYTAKELRSQKVGPYELYYHGLWSIKDLKFIGFTDKEIRAKIDPKDLKKAA